MTYSMPLGAAEGVPVSAPGKYLNRHGLITGSTGTGKSVSIIGMVEALSRIGVPSLVTDVKGDLSGLAAPSDKTTDNGRNGLAWWAEAAPVRLLDVFGKAGEPLQASVSDIGAPLMSRALGLSDTQAGVLEVAYAVAEDTGAPLHTLADLRAVVAHCSEERETIGRRYGLVTPSSVAAIGRAVLRLERAGGAAFFGPQTTDLETLVSGNRVNLLDCVQLIREPRLYGAVLLWLLDKLSRELPEVGDLAKPRFCLFLDEAHLIFSDCPPDVLRAVDQTVRLIRSKGVGVFFASQSPADIPDGIARQLHLRVQHALRAVTPRDRALVKAAAESMPPGEGFKVAGVIEHLPPGAALVSFMGADGKPTATQILAMQLPRCRLSPLTAAERAHLYQPAPASAPPQPPPARQTGMPGAGHWFARVLVTSGITVTAGAAFLLAVAWMI